MIRLRKAGRTYDEIAAQTGLSRTGAFNICKRHKAVGAAALQDAPGGRRLGQGQRLSAAQEATVRKRITDKTPDQLKMPYALWSRAAVSELIGQSFSVRLPVRTMGLHLARWGFTPQKPMKKACEQSPGAVKKWVEDNAPRSARAKVERAEIHWGDETGLRSDDVHGRSYAPEGRTPVVRVNNQRHGLPVISTVTSKGKMRWKAFDGALNPDILVDFLRRLVKDAGRKVCLILDNLRVHHGKPVRTWLAKHQDEIEVFYFPSYSPELNPNEIASADLKQAVTKLAPARTKSQWVKATASHLRSVQRQPARIKSHFEHEPVRYAA